MNAKIEGLEILGPAEPIVGQFINGFYIDITPTWFRDVGTIILIVMILNIFVTPFGIMVSYFYKLLKRIYYQKFTLSRRITRAKTQTQYQNLYSGPEFILDGRYAEILNLVFVSFTLSPAMPILYFVALINLIVLYWVDKFLILRVTIRPKKMSEKLEKMVVGIMGWSVVPHLLMAIWIYGNPRIINENLEPNSLAKLMLKPKETDLYSQSDNPLFEFRDRLSRSHNIFFTFILIGILALGVALLFFYGPIMSYLNNVMKKLFKGLFIESNEKLQKTNFYDLLSREQVRQEIILTTVNIDNNDVHEELRKRYTKKRYKLGEVHRILRYSFDAAAIKFSTLYTYDIKVNPKFKKIFRLDQYDDMNIELLPLIEETAEERKKRRQIEKDLANFEKKAKERKKKTKKNAKKEVEKDETNETKDASIGNQESQDNSKAESKQDSPKSIPSKQEEESSENKEEKKEIDPELAKKDFEEILNSDLIV